MPLRWRTLEIKFLLCILTVDKLVAQSWLVFKEKSFVTLVNFRKSAPQMCSDSFYNVPERDTNRSKIFIKMRQKKWVPHQALHCIVAAVASLKEVVNSHSASPSDIKKFHKQRVFYTWETCLYFSSLCYILFTCTHSFFIRFVRKKHIEKPGSPGDLV